MRLFLLFLGLVAMVLIPFFIWEDTLMAAFSQEGSIEWLSSFGIWAWAAGIILLMGDLFLPIPATLVMAALGYLYGPIIGGIISSVGSFMAGAFGYWLCRLFGEKGAIWLLGEKDFEKGQNLFGRVGGWLVVLSRWLPVFPEVISCMAGLTRMKPLHFHLALATGSIPMGFTYAIIGQMGVDSPGLAIGLSAGLPPVIWIVVRLVMKRRFGY
ncbi:MAG: VTT domain-containing protein [Bacteroidia bacterium]